MNSGLYTACSGLKANAEMLEVLSNNLANTNTTGFKSDESFFRIYNHALSESTVAPLDRVINDSAVVQGSRVNFLPGPLSVTGGDLDVALEGQGFFVLEAPNGPLYTRNGNFHVSSDRHLVNSEGLAVLGKNGPVRLPPGQISISQSGDIQVNGSARVDTIRVVDFPDKRQLEKMGNSLFRVNAEGVKPIESKDAVVRQGALEQSNVNPIRQMMLMINMMRQFESLQKTIELTMNTLNDRSINQVGRVVG
jgi:flagellar basal-body rod protein FlgF